ncbi:sigma-70 family RNA polymerase sigma factor [Proteinivorax hydrogeniformans]|uniref:Sigma-70 family RNA polymerase sigma factor n=1 Tax=Proteinivorax hydrogeniformans TaxID=1826727 RepID=A0AAU8HUW6_9FIRM
MNKELIDMVHKGIYYFINRYSISLQDQQDVYNNCVVKILESYPQFDAQRGVKLNIYLMAKIRGEVKKWVRQKGKEVPSELNVDNESTWGNPEEELDNYLDSKLLQKGISSLSLRQRQVLKMKYFDHMTFKEIAEHLSVNYQTVIKYHNRGVKMLRKKLDEKVW